MANTIVEGLRERIMNATKINQTVGIIVPGGNYADLIEAIMEYMLDTTDDIWVYVTVTKPFDVLAKNLKNLSSHKNIHFIDCISHASGISKLQSNCTYIESPTMLEKITMEIMNVFRDIDKDVERYIIIDSLSAFMIYNDPATVTEFFYHLINKTKSSDIHSISIVVEDEEMSKYLSKIIFLNDKILKVRDSFI